MKTPIQIETALDTLVAWVWADCIRFQGGAGDHELTGATRRKREEILAAYNEAYARALRAPPLEGDGGP